MLRTPGAVATGARALSGGAVARTSAPRPWHAGAPPKRWDGARRTVAVLGATGFLGRYVTSHLCRAGHTVVTPFRGSQMDARHLKVCGDVGQVVLLPYNARSGASLDRALEGVDCVVNLVGREWATKNYELEEVHVRVARQIAERAREAGTVKSYVHFSAQGADEDSPAAFFSTKAEGEAAVADALAGSGIELSIVRPTPVFGHEDTFTNGYAALAFKMRYMRMPLFHDPEAMWQPVYSVDVAAAVTALVDGDGHGDGALYELGGPETKPFEEWIRDIYGQLHEEPRYVSLPGPIISAVTNFTERFQHRPAFTSATARAASAARVARRDPENGVFSIEDLGITTTPLSAVAIRWLRRHRHHTKQGLL
eukprot:TRINITY_DN723_c0_g2_i1.p1 TRINITY_DN723_c0_g2~~TRINITY_DN723_c0_g2_i1.p1  ORF type:complete len:416 (+),score=156.53 TRINITY_DN723_c0_g2_i1:150-1250(+)